MKWLTTVPRWSLKLRPSGGVRLWHSVLVILRTVCDLSRTQGSSRKSCRMGLRVVSVLVVIVLRVSISVTVLRVKVVGAL